MPWYAMIETGFEAARFTSDAGIDEAAVDLAGVAVAGQTKAETWMSFLGFSPYDCVET